MAGSTQWLFFFIIERPVIMEGSSDSEGRRAEEKGGKSEHEHTLNRSVRDFAHFSDLAAAQVVQQDRTGELRLFGDEAP